MKSKTIISLVGLVFLISGLSLGCWVFYRSAMPWGEIAGDGDPPVVIDGGVRHEVVTIGILETPKVRAEISDEAVAQAVVSCSSCHRTRDSVRATAAAKDLNEFHQGLVYEHGEMSCLSCHDSDNYDRLRLASGESLDYSDSMQLCAQCHGPQHRDYQKGSHGGMIGYWDLKRGGRARNNCTVCHDAHAPAYPEVMPVFPPKDLTGHNQSEH